MQEWGGVLLIAVLISCGQSPEARRDKYLARGKALVEKKEFSRAILEFRNAVQAMPKDAEPYYQMAMAAATAGDVVGAATGLRKVLELNPKHAGARLRMAQLLSSTNDKDLMENAESRLKDLLESTPANAEVLNTLAFTELKLGKTEDAAQSLQQALAQAPQNLTASILLARTKVMQKDLKGAEEVLKKAREAAPQTAGSHVILGKFYRAQARMAEAEAEFLAALKIDSNNGPALADLAMLQTSLGRKHEAAENFKRLAGFADKTYKPVYGLFLYQEGRREEAVREFEKLNQKDPEDRPARTRLVMAYRGVNRGAEAEKLLAAALTKNPKDLDALLQRAEMFLMDGKHGQVEADLNAVLHLNPNSAEVHYIVSKLHQARGATLSYKGDLFKALQLNPFLLPARLQIAGFLIGNGDGRSALDVLKETPGSQKDLLAVLIQRNWALWALGDLTEMRKGIDLGLARERTPELLLQDGLWMLRQGNFAGARATMEEALKVNPADIRALEGLRQTYVGQNQNSMALQRVKEFAAQHAKSAPVQQFLGILLMAHGDKEQARAAFVAAKTSDPQFAQADLSLVQLAVLERRWDDARNRLLRIVADHKNDAVALLWLGVVEELKGNYTAAIDRYRKVIEAEPQNIQALNNLAYLLTEHGNKPDEALKYAEKAGELSPQDPDIADTLGWIYYRKGLYSLAVRHLERAASMDKGRAVPKYHLAMAYAKGDNAARARATFAVALKLNPNLPEAKAAKELLEQNR
jgi:tetratricopeptide (TPR) repeat protein